ncbi:phosphatase [soil metagenome]
MALAWVVMTTPSAVSEAAGAVSPLRDHLVAARLAGSVATTRENNLDHYAAMARREPYHLLGLVPSRRWSSADVLALMVERCGVVADPDHRVGTDTIDPDLTIAGLDAMGARLQVAAERRERVLVATGHPVGLGPTHTAVLQALAAAGCTVLTPADGWRHPAASDYEQRTGTLGYLDGLGVLLGSHGRPVHTHSPLPVQAALRALSAAGEPPPDLVVADHGWAGGAGQAGIDAVGFADCNDPALFVGEAEGCIVACVPLDDNVAPHLYAPLTAYLLVRAGLST